MPKRPSSKNDQKSTSRNVDSTIVVAMIGLIGTLMAAIFASPVLVAWIQRSPPPITIPAETAVPLLATATESIVTATGGVTSTAALSAVPPILAGQDWQTNCIASEIWTPYKGQAKPQDERMCWQLRDRDWGMSAQSGALLISQTRPASETIHGIYTPIAASSKIDFTAQIDKMSTLLDQDGNVAFGIVPSNSPDPAKGVFLLFQVQESQPDSPVYIKIHEPEGSDQYLSIPYKLGSKREITLQLDGFLFSISIDGEEVHEPISIPFAKQSFWIGYTVPGGGSLSTTISDLSIKQ